MFLRNKYVKLRDLFSFSVKLKSHFRRTGRENLQENQLNLPH